MTLLDALVDIDAILLGLLLLVCIYYMCLRSYYNIGFLKGDHQWRDPE